MFFVFSQNPVFQSRKPNFKSGAHAIPFLFFLFERACQGARNDVLTFLIKLVFVMYTHANIYKIPIFMVFFRSSTCHFIFFHIKTENLQKGQRHSLQFDMLFLTKKKKRI